uniref:Uncharacterized protein n=1 Tax=Streptomyces phage Geonosis TaxID=3158856 RepID=A0AAU7GWE7_9CAUD
MTATATQAARFESGDVVWGRPVREGKAQARRKGIVLGLFGTDDHNQLVVWWYGQGPAGMDTTTLAFARELTKGGDIFDMGAAQAAKLARGCYRYERAHSVGRSLERHARRMKSLGAQFPA